ncbi:S8 family peptidase [Mesotoga sp. B105.6.4]|uniref:S8 family peptidase n=1 Tax=Mesotoga sp. B105.6.4 TaxID=1582224 RepID=UPI002155989B|nr:S8 family peptidase [Mesotoga sp. B105.6.4]
MKIKFFALITLSTTLIIMLAGCPTPTKFTLTVTTSPDLALDIRIDGTLFTSPKGMIVNSGTTKQISVDTPQQKDISPWLTGIDARYVFSNWNDGNASNPRNVRVNSDTTYTADMNAEYRIDRASTPSLWEVFSTWYERGSEVEFSTFQQLETYNFSHWLINGENRGSSNPIVLVIDKPLLITAVYAQQQAQYTLTVTTIPETGLNISIGGTNYTSPKTVTLNSGTSRAIEVTSPQEKDKSAQVTGTDTRFTFIQWSDTNTNNPRTITLNSDMTYTAEMKVEYKVATGTNPAGGTVDGAAWYMAGTVKNFTAPVRTGYTFSHWVINGANMGDANPITVNVNSPKNVIAHYNAETTTKNIFGTVTPYTGNIKTADLNEMEILSNTEIRTTNDKPEYIENEYLLKVESFKEAEESFSTSSLPEIQLIDRIEDYYSELKYLHVRTTASEEELRGLQGVVQVSRNSTFYALETTPNDTYYSLQWNYPLINLPRAWDYTVGSRSVVVAVIDSGFSTSHPDLAGIFESGYNFIDNNTNVSEPNTSEDSHGTHVVGTIAALTNNGKGVSGVTWGGFGITLIPIRGIKDAAALMNSIIYAVDHGAKVINMSLGGASDSPAVYDAVKYAARNGVVMVAASGNNGDGNILYPARYPETIAVGAVWEDRGTITRSSYSCFGPALDVVAPGGYMRSGTDPNGIYSTGWTPLGNTYMYMQGTSMATPHVTGVVALLMGSGLTDPDDIRSVLRNTAVDLGTPGRDYYYGWGLVDAEAALDAITSPQEFKVFLRNPSTGTNITSTNLSDSGAYHFSDVSNSQVEIFAWRDMDESGTIDTGDLLGYYNYSGGKPNLNNAQTITLSGGDNWIDFQFAPIIGD